MRCSQSWQGRLWKSSQLIDHDFALEILDGRVEGGDGS